MISKERVRQMTKLAEYDAADGKKYEKMTQYFREDYVAMEMIKSFFAGTIGFGLLFLLWLLYEMETLSELLVLTDLVTMGIITMLVYITFMVVFLLITYVVYNKRYTEGRKQIKNYYNRLQKVQSIYRSEEQEQLQGEWED
ncbi:MAG: hypothetical protein ACI4DO_09035 [Roseburia sp.]